MSNKQIRKSGPVQLPVSFLRGGAAAASPLSLYPDLIFVVYMVKVTGRGSLVFATKVMTLAAG